MFIFRDKKFSIFKISFHFSLHSFAWQLVGVKRKLRNLFSQNMNLTNVSCPVTIKQQQLVWVKHVDWLMQWIINYVAAVYSRWHTHHSCRTLLLSVSVKPLQTILMKPMTRTLRRQKYTIIAALIVQCWASLNTFFLSRVECKLK